MTIRRIVHHESFAVILYEWTNNNGEIEVTILRIVHHELSALLLKMYLNRGTTTVRWK